MAQDPRPLVAGNWKMNGLAASVAELEAIMAGVAEKAPAAELMICPPATLISLFAKTAAGSGIAIGAQDCHAEVSGAFTGDLSAEMLKDAGASAVIVGHSERRTLHGETDQIVADKARAALAAGLTPVVCVGESLADRDAGSTLAVIQRQLEPVLALGAGAVSRMVLAYEPVWAIGTGRSATPEQAQEVHGAIRAALAALGAARVQVLYGGSVKAANAASLFAMPDIDGALVGGASLVAEEFLRIAAI